jgi:ribonuclease HI
MELDIYTDCGVSKNQKFFGVGIHMIDANESEQSYLLKTNIDLINKQFNSKSKGTTGLGELYAILQSCQLISPKYTKIRIFTDSDHAFRICNSQKIKGKSGKDEIYNKIYNSINFYKNFFDIEFFWIKGHIGVYGNHIADSLTQEAKKLKSSDKDKIHKVEIPKVGEPIKIFN